jgi:hypothetical protein
MSEVVAEVHDIECEYSTKDELERLAKESGKLKMSCLSLTYNVRIEGEISPVHKLDRQSLLILAVCGDSGQLGVHNG